MRVPLHPLSTYQIGTAMQGPVDKAKLKFKLKDCSPLNYTSRLKVYFMSGKFVKSLRIKTKD